MKGIAIVGVEGRKDLVSLFLWWDGGCASQEDDSSSNQIPQINWEINNHNNNISPRLCASVCVCVCEREKVWGRCAKQN